MEFVLAEGGEFEMGDVFDDGNTNEIPVHEVHVNGFWIGKYLVTQGQWEAVMGSNPSQFKMGNDYPVEQVGWYDVEAFVKRLNEKTKMNFRPSSCLYVNANLKIRIS
jgi:formylglycine-generating enzyme required for sulfatase activity